MKKDLDYYISLEYQVILRPLSESDGGGWLAEIPELKGCCSDGDSPEEALNNVKEAKSAWIKTALKRQQEIPEPSIYEEEQYSGKFTLRLPKFLHKELSTAAKNDQMSLNSYLLSLISLNFGKSIGRKNTENQTPIVNNVYVYSPQNEVQTDLRRKYDTSLNFELWQQPLPENELGGKRRW